MTAFLHGLVRNRLPEARRQFHRYRQYLARENVKAAGLTVVYDRRYPSATTDLAPVVRAIAETKPDIVIVCSYPPDSVGMVRAVNEVDFKPKMIGGAMVGLQSTAIKARLGPLVRVAGHIDKLPIRDVVEERACIGAVLWTSASNDSRVAGEHGHRSLL
jgi:hypothetical protein